MGSGVKVGELYGVLRLERGGFAQAVKGAGADVDGLGRKFDNLIKKPGLLGSALKKGLAIGAGIAGFNLLQTSIRGVTDAIGDAVHAAKEEEVVQAALRASLQANIAGWDGNVESINKVIDARLRLGFTDDQQAQSLAVLVAMTKDSAASLDIERTAMDLARLKHMDLASAATVLGKAYNGNFIALKRLGIQVDKNATGVEALGLVQARVAGQAEAFAKTEEGAAQGAAAEWEKFQEDLGGLLLPVLKAVQIALRDQVIPALREALPVLVDIGSIVFKLASFTFPVLIAAVGVKLVTAFEAAGAAGVASATATKLAWQAALLGVPALFEFIREKQQDFAKEAGRPTLPFEFLGGPFGPGDFLGGLFGGASPKDAGRQVGEELGDGLTDGLIAASRAGFFDPIPEELQAAADAANAILSTSAHGFAATLADGSTIFAGSAEVLAGRLPTAVGDARALAEAEAAKVPKGLADAIIGSIGDFDAMHKEIVDAIAGAVTDASAIAQAAALLAGKDITKAFGAGSTELDLAMIDAVDKLATSLSILAPNALTTGEGIPLGLRDGVQKNLQLAVDAMDRLRVQSGSKLDLATFAELMGEDGIAAYIRGLKTPPLTKTSQDLANSVQDELEIDLYGPGRNAATSWLSGFNSVNFPGVAAGRLRELKRNLVGESPPPEGPLKDLDLGAARAAQAWVDSFDSVFAKHNVTPALAGLIPGEGGPTLARAAAVGALALPGAARSQGDGSLHVTIAHMEVNGVGSDVSPAAQRRLGQGMMNEFASQLRDNRAQIVRDRPASPG